MKNNDPRSLLERLEAHHQAGYLSLHMPGHKENTALAPYLAQLGAQWDITELPGFDDLHDPQDILAQAMDRAAHCSTMVSHPFHKNTAGFRQHPPV